MTPKNEREKLVPELLQSIDPRGIADPSLRQTIEVLLNLIEELNLKVKSLEEENQKLRDENNRLKGEKGKPDIFMSLVTTTRKLGISFFKYMQDRISKNCEIPSLGTIIREKSLLNPETISWQEELFLNTG